MGTVAAIKEAYQAYFSTGGYGVLFIVAALWFAAAKGPGSRENRIKQLLGPLAVLGAVCACPLSAKLIMLAAGEDVYWRVFWMFPVLFILAAAGTVLVCERRTRRGKALAALCCAGMIALNGSFVFGDAFFTKRENNFKLPTPVIRVADAVNAHAKANNIRRKKTVSPASIAVYLRIYDASIRQRYGRYTLMHSPENNILCTQINKDQINYRYLTARAQMARIRYIILTSQTDDRAQMEALGYENIYDDTGYAVYFDTRYYKKTRSHS